MRLPWRRGGDAARPGAGADAHERARTLAADGLGGPLPPEDAAWLAGHLEACEQCRADAAAFEADRDLLRSLRDRQPDPPRDLWARTSAALEREMARDARRAAGAGEAASPPGRTPAGARGRAGYRYSSRTSALRSILVVLVALAATSLLNQSMPGLPPPSGSATTGRGATPIPVSADVGWLQPGTDGTYDVILTRIDRVCPSEDQSACEPVKDSARGSITLGARPRSVSLSPDAGHLVVVSAGATAGSSVLVVAVPTPRPATPVPSVSATPAPTATAPAPTPDPGGPTPAGPSSSPSLTIVPSLSPSGTPAATPLPTGGPDSVAIAEAVIIVGGTPAYAPDGTWFAFSARPADGSAGPDIFVWQPGLPRAHAITTDHRSIFSSWLGSRIVGSRAAEPERPRPASPAPPSAAASATPPPDTTQSAEPPATASSALSATPAGSEPGSTATPDAVTSPASPAPSPTTAASGSPQPDATRPPSSPPSVPPGQSRVLGTESFLLDPATGAVEAIERTQVWRPVVDPTGRHVVYWNGTLAADAAGVSWQPGSGAIVVAPWPLGPAAGGPGTAPGGTSGPTPSAPNRTPASSPDPSSAPSAAPSGGPSTAPSGPASPAASIPGTPRSSQAAGATASRPPSGTRPPTGPDGAQTVVDGPVLDFDAQFDPTGRFLAIWVANPADVSTGFLTLYAVDDATGAVTPAHTPLVNLPALRSFSIGPGRLAWVTAGQAGSPSRIEIIGWTAGGFGTVETLPAESLLVIR